MCLRLYIKLIWESPTTEDKNFRHRRYAPFIQNSNQIASRLTATSSFPRIFFQLLQYSRQGPSFSAHRAAPITKLTWLFQHFLRIVDFAVHFCFRCKFSFHEERRFESGLTAGLTVAWFSWTNHNSSLISETASFCIDNRLRSVMLKDFEIKKSFIWSKWN